MAITSLSMKAKIMHNITYKVQHKHESSISRKYSPCFENYLKMIMLFFCLSNEVRNKALCERVAALSKIFSLSRAFVTFRNLATPDAKVAYV